MSAWSAASAIPAASAILANRPSQTSDRAGTRHQAHRRATARPRPAALRGNAASCVAVPVINPSCRDLHHRASKSPPNIPARSRARRIRRRIDRPSNIVDDLMLSADAVERRDHRLDDGDGAVDGPGVAPAFQRMRQRQMPGAERRGLVAVKAGMEAFGPAATSRRKPSPPVQHRPDWRR